MIIIFNWIGAGIILLSMVIGGVLASGLVIFFGAAALPLSMAAGGIIVIILDLLYRYKAGEGDLLHPRKGGHVFFIPVWILGGLFILGALGELVSPGLLSSERRAARQTRPDPIPVYARTADQAQPQRMGPVATPSRPTVQQTVLAEPVRTFDGLKVGMISGAAGHRIATINSEPFSEGESHKLTLGQRRVTIQCVEIREQLVVVKVQGEEHIRPLKVGELVTLPSE